ncbi:MAG TPA: hypothetical protein V6D14_08850 [Coleofasciculaceae cyanobacterium]|jgi:hypothetical protein
MRLTTLISVILLTTIGLVSNPLGSPQTASNSQLKQAFSAQNWRRTIQAVNQINRVAEVQPNLNLIVYKALLSHR